MIQIRSYLVLATTWLVLLGTPCIAYSADADKKTPEAIVYEKDVDILTDLVVTMMPLGKIFESIAAEDPAWPFQHQPGRATQSQLSCMRSELSTEGFRRLKRKYVEIYAAEHRDTLKADIQLLESGVAELFGKMVMAGADAERKGVEADTDAIMKSATPAEIESFTLFFDEPKLLELRKLAGVGNTLSNEKIKDENETAGEQLGQDIASKFMSTAMKTCEVN